MPPAPRHPRCLRQHREQIVEVRKILHHRIQNHEIDTVVRHLAQVIGHPSPQFHVLQRRLPRDHRPHPRQRRRREIDPHIPATSWRHARQQQPRPTPDLQHLAGPHLLDPRHRLLDPDPHLLDRQRLPRITTPPPRQV